MSDEEQIIFNDYMKDIIKKISDKGRKYKVTYKKRYIHDSINSLAAQRISSVYVIVINNNLQSH